MFMGRWNVLPVTAIDYLKLSVLFQLGNLTFYFNLQFEQMFGLFAFRIATRIRSFRNPFLGKN